ncbi:PAS domain-containing protein [uncultured Desulfosarcina sp.]|uniref:PAS domain-containing protein n=1 Tax=uncultured Desulfosarcina sp. TaxID=218289 RepID=UPI0029C7A07B|nr:PAS domain-containing protein [uncultured Desulfosarcina sp.]
MNRKPSYEELEQRIKALEIETGKHRALADAPFEAIFLSEKGICLDQNQAAEKMFGYSHAEAIGRHGTEWIAPEYRAQVRTNMQARYEKPYEVVALRKDGTAFPCEIQARMTDSHGQAIRVTALRDITEKKQAEQLLKDEVVQRRILVDQSRDGIVILDQEGNVYEANRRFAAMLGYTVEEVQRLSVWDWDFQWSKARLLEMLRKVDDTGDHFETVHKRKDGTLYEAEISTNGAVYQNRKLVFCVCRDITERKRSEEERKQLIQELQAALAEVKTLRGIIPICTQCKKIRDDDGYWQRVEQYIEERSDVLFTHGICEECAKKLYPWFEDEE